MSGPNSRWERSRRKPRRRAPGPLGAVVTALLLAITTTPVGNAVTAGTSAERRDVLFVGNNWDGTAEVIEAHGQYRRIGRINVIPDKRRRMREIHSNPVKLAYFLGVRHGPGEGHDQFVDDMYSTPDGASVVVSRPSFADVVSIGLSTGEIEWRFPVSGHRADHMAVSPDGTRVAVSASTSNTVHVLDIDTGEELGSFPTGDKPHENVFTSDGEHLWNMSIGEVFTDLDAPWLDFTKGDRRITVANAHTYEVVDTIDMRERLDAFGRPDLSDAIRPVAFTPGESTMYFQVSFFHGFVEYDVTEDRITRVKTLPKNPDTDEDRTSWVNDSRHHGIAMEPSGEKLCVTATMDDYATVVDRDTLRQGPLVEASKPYWATVSGDGEHCVISESGADRISVLDFDTGRKVTTVPVGDHPQRVRLGEVPAGWQPPA